MDWPWQEIRPPAWTVRTETSGSYPGERNHVGRCRFGANYRRSSVHVRGTRGHRRSPRACDNCAIPGSSPTAGSLLVPVGKKQAVDHLHLQIEQAIPSRAYAGPCYRQHPRTKPLLVTMRLGEQTLLQAVLPEHHRTWTVAIRWPAGTRGQCMSKMIVQDRQGTVAYLRQVERPLKSISQSW